MSDAGPHKFKALRLWDKRPGGRCLHCYAPRHAHPMHCWVVARPLGDGRRAELTYQMLAHGPKEDA